MLYTNLSESFEILEKYGDRNNTDNMCYYLNIMKSSLKRFKNWALHFQLFNKYIILVVQ